MDREPQPEESQTEPGPRTQPGWPPPPPPPEYAPYRLPPRPPRRPTSVWRILSNLIGLCLLLLVLVVIAGLAFSMWGSRRVGTLAGERLGLLRIEGEIYQGEDKEFWLETLHDFGTNDSIKGVLVRIDSPGGTVGASQELSQAILKLRKDHGKPVYVSMGDVAASGGYYTAAAADRIYALKGTLTGSIGVILSKPDVTSLTQKLGYSQEIVKSGRFKDAGDMFRPMTADERKVFDVLIMDTYSQFIGDVLANRREALAQAAKSFGQWEAMMLSKPDNSTPEAFLRRVADGRVYTGEQALHLGLVDEIGTLEDTKAALGKKVGLGAQPKVQEVKRERGLGDLFSAKMGDLIPTGRSPLKYLMHWP